MRSIPWLGVPVVAVVLFCGGCGGGSDSGGGSTSAPSVLKYTTETAVYIVGTAITANRPRNAGGAVSSYSVSPNIPSGLALSTSTGAITGTPTAMMATVSYVVTASNSAGKTSATLTITVNAGAAGNEFLPNLNRWITPLAPPGSQYQTFDTGLTINGNPWLAGQAASSVVNGNTLLVLTSGYNRIFNTDSHNPSFENAGEMLESTEYVFIYDISTGTPVVKQVLTVPNTYNGITFDPTRSDVFYVSSGEGNFPFAADGMTFPLPGDLPFYDSVHTFIKNADSGVWSEDLVQIAPGSPPVMGPLLALNHAAGVGLPVNQDGPFTPPNNAVSVNPCAAGVAVSKTGQTLVVANYYNDSVTIFTGGYPNWTPANVIHGSSEPGNLDLRPGKALVAAPQTGIPGGEYPFWVVIAGAEPNAIAYVSSIRDREIDVVPLTPPTTNPPTAYQVTVRIPVKGQPNKMTLNKAQTLLYVAVDQSDTVDVVDIDPAHPLTANTVVETIPVLAPQGLLPASFYSAASTTNPQYTGANTNSVTLSNDETRLYVTNGNLNNVAVVALTGTNSGDQVVGLIPTGWYPTSVNFSADGSMAYVVNMKSPTGANPTMCYSHGPPTYPNCWASNAYNPELTKAGLQNFPVPSAAQLATLTAQVAMNNGFAGSAESARDAAVMAAVSKGVKHVIFIIKENRTYDQVLGDLVNAKGVPIGDGDPKLVQWGQAITPNLHSLARTFVTLDRFFATAEVSYDGWMWTTSARATDVVEHQYLLPYAGRGLSLDNNGANRSVNVGYPTVAERQLSDPLTPDDPDLLPGQTDVSAADGPNNELNTGHLWDAALRAGLTVHNYGFFIDESCYNVPSCQIPLAHDPASTNTTVAYPTNAALTPYTDPYFRGFDTNFPDFYRYAEWERDFDANYTKSGLPALSLVYFMHDHTGTFGTAIDLVNTPELQEADNDYAVGLLVQKIATSVYAQNTLIFVVEDDAQDGGDHVDSHRTDAFVVGAYVKRGVVISTPYTTLDFVRTMEEVLGLKQRLNLNDALAHPMADIFTTKPRRWSFTAAPSTYLYATNLPLPLAPPGMVVPQSTHDAAYWARVTKGLDFSEADRVDGVAYNRILWKGMMGNQPYPPALNGKHLGHDGEKMPARYHPSAKEKAARQPTSDVD